MKMDRNIFNTMCRICFQRKETLFSVFNKCKGLSPYEKLVNNTKLVISLNDGGPASICSQCLMELDNAINFLVKCEKSNQMFQKYQQCYEKESNLSVAKLDFDSRIKVKEVQESLEIEEAVLISKPSCPECGAHRRCRHWTAPKVHTCKYCQKVFNRRFNFNLHLKRHLGKRDWACPSCGVAQLTAYAARLHCVPPKRRACPEPGCNKTFTTNTNLATHLRAHRGERPFVCGDCGKGFTSKNTLNDHIRIHTGEKPYICPICGKQFTTNKLTAHIATHGEDRLARNTTTTDHTRARAGRVRCAQCNTSYAHAQSLRKHRHKHHPPKADTEVNDVTNEDK